MLIKFGSLFLIILMAVTLAIALWQVNKPRERLFYVFCGLVICGPFPLLTVWLVNYSYLPEHDAAYGLAIPVIIVLILVISFIGDAFKL